jgi:hypothetical protein
MVSLGRQGDYIRWTRNSCIVASCARVEKIISGSTVTLRVDDLVIAAVLKCLVDHGVEISPCMKSQV